MMSTLAKLVAIVALPCLLAAECESGNCPQEETSLMQMAAKMMERSSPNADGDFKPLPENHTKIDEAMKRKSSNSGLPMTKHRVNNTKGKDDKNDDKEAPAAAPKQESHDDEPKAPPANQKKAIDQDKNEEQKAQDKMRKAVASGNTGDLNPADKKKSSGDKEMNKEAKKMAKEMEKQAKELGDAIKQAMGGGGNSSDGIHDPNHDHHPDGPEPAWHKGAENAKDQAIQAAMTEVDLRLLEEAEAAKNAAMVTAANAAAAEDRVAMQLAAQAQKMVDKNRVKVGTPEERKKLNGAIAEEVAAEMEELSARSKIEKQALRDAVAKVEAAVIAAKAISVDAAKSAAARTGSKHWEEVMNPYEHEEEESDGGVKDEVKRMLR